MIHIVKDLIRESEFDKITRSIYNLSISFRYFCFSVMTNRSRISDSRVRMRASASPRAANRSRAATETTTAPQLRPGARRRIAHTPSRPQPRAKGQSTQMWGCGRTWEILTAVLKANFAPKLKILLYNNFFPSLHFLRLFWCESLRLEISAVDLFSGISWKQVTLFDPVTKPFHRPSHEHFHEGTIFFLYLEGSMH